MATYNDNYNNAVVGRLVDMANRSWGDNRRMVVIETDDPFATIIVRRFVNNWQDAELLIDRTVCVYNDTIIHIPQEATK